MKKYILIVFLLFSVASTALAAEGLSQEMKCSPSGKLCVLELSWTSAADGSFTTTYLSYRIDGYVTKVVTDPGATAPTPVYDITLLDDDSQYIMGGACEDRDTANTETVYPYDTVNGSPVYSGVPVYGNLRLAIANNAVNSATGVIKIYIDKAL